MRDIGKKRGRPCGEISRKRNCRVALSDEEFDSVERLSRITGKTKADIFREAVQLLAKVEMSKRPLMNTYSDDLEVLDDYDDVYDDFYEEY